MENKGLTLNEYQQRAMTTCTESSNNCMYGFSGLNAEVGEINDKVAKAIRKEIVVIRDNNVGPDINAYDGALPNDSYREFHDGMKKELGDVMWFCAHIANQFGWTLEEVAQLNLDKLADRAKRGVIVGNGDNR